MRQLSLATRSVFYMFTSRPALTAISTFSKMLTRAGIFLIVAPLIGPASQGVMVTTSAWSAIIALIVSYGFQVKVLRAIPVAPDRAMAILKGDLYAMLALCVPAFVAAVAAGFIVIDRQNWVVFSIVFIATLNSVVGDYISCALRSLNHFMTETCVAFAAGFAQFALVVAAGVATHSLLAIVIALLVSRVFFSVLSLVVVFQSPTVANSARHKPEPLLSNIRQSWAYFVDASLSVCLSQIDIVILNFMVDKDIIGIYAAGSRLVQLMLAVPWVITNFMVPAIAGKKDLASREREIKRLATGILIVAVGGAAFLLIGGPLFTSYLLGYKFVALNNYWIAFAFLLVAKLFEAYGGIIMTSMGRMTERVKVQIAAIGVITAGSLILVPHFGALGMILSLILASAATEIYYAIKLGEQDPIARRAIVILACLLIVGGTLAILLADLSAGAK